MSSGSGGSSIIAAYAAVQYFLGRRRSTEVDDERARLDDEELRLIEYTSMGLAAPEQRRTTRPRSLADRLLRFRRSR